MIRRAPQASALHSLALRLHCYVLIGATSGCLFGRRTAAVDSQDGADSLKDVLLAVENQNYYDATIYAIRGSARERLGVVPSQKTESFRLRWRAERVSFVIQLLAVGSFTTEEIEVSPGDELELRIAPDLHRSKVSR
ncbi:MAG: hypothetical protein HY700_20510 [Gemmatimonadetes bacterium]|nr:hypothetical protein [Gemmatimonadota bacterium]